jgi:hypothetical protein
MGNVGGKAGQEQQHAKQGECHLSSFHVQVLTRLPAQMDMRVL